MNYSIENIGARIAAARKRKAMTQGQLADLLSVSPQAVSKWENGLAYPDIMTLPRVAEFLEVSMDELFGLETPQPEEPDKTFAFPAEFHGLPLAASYKDRAVYSETEVTEHQDEKVNFVDGSEADLAEGVVVNRGISEILLVYDHQIKEDHTEEAPPDHQEKVSEPGAADEIRGYDMDLNGDAEIVIREGAESRWKADGSMAFMSNLDIYKSEDGILHIKLGSYMRNWFFFGGKNKVNGRIEITAPRKVLDSLNVRFRSSGTLTADIDFRNAALNVSGSADVRLADCGNLDSKIAGSGSVYVHKCENLKLSIAGSGDIRIIELNGELLRGRLAGSGDVTIDRGHVEQMDVSAAGSGNIFADDLVVERSRVSIAGSGGVSVGAILGESIEHVVGSGRVRVKRRA